MDHHSIRERRSAGRDKAVPARDFHFAKPARPARLQTFIMAKRWQVNTEPPQRAEDCQAPGKFVCIAVDGDAKHAGVRQRSYEQMKGKGTFDILGMVCR